MEMSPTGVLGSVGSAGIGELDSLGGGGAEEPRRRGRRVAAGYHDELRSAEQVHRDNEFFLNMTNQERLVTGGVGLAAAAAGACAFVCGPYAVSVATNIAAGGGPLAPAASAFLNRFGPSATSALSRLQGVPIGPMQRAMARLQGLNVGGKSVVQSIHAFGSRAGSTFRGRGPSSQSDLDLVIRVNQKLINGRSGPWVRSVLQGIRTDFENATGFPLQILMGEAAEITTSPVIQLFVR